MNELQTALWITAIGMGLVFGAILILWLMMTLLTRLTADRSPASDSTKANSLTPTAKRETLARAAALGVALAISEQQLSSAHPLAQPPTAIISAWQLGMRTRQMTQKGGRRHR